MSYGFYQAGYSRQDVGTTFVGARVFTVEDTNTNSVVNIATLQHATTSGGAAGIGAGLLFQDDNNLGNVASAARASGILTTATSGSEVGALVLESMSGGSLTEGLRVTAGVARAPSGAVGGPSYGFTGDVDTGIYLVGDGNLGVTVAGANRLEFTATFADFKTNILVGQDGSAASPSFAHRVDTDTGMFWVSSTGNILGFAAGGGECLRMNASELVVNEQSADLDFRVESNGNANMIAADGGLDCLGLGGAVDSQNPVRLYIGFGTLTAQQDLDTAFMRVSPSLYGNGTNAILAGLWIDELNIPGGGPTPTTAATLYVTGAPAGGTNNYALWVDAGLARFDGGLDLSGISAGTRNMIIVATSDTPTVAWTGGGSAPTTAPAGYMEITVGANQRYIPFWA